MTDTDLSDARLREILAEQYESENNRSPGSAEFIRLTKYRGVVSVEVALAAMRRVASRPQQGENAGLVKELLDHANEQAALIHVIEDWRDATKRHHKKTEELCRRSASALSRAGNGIPEGWQLVPKEANEAMLHAMRGPFQIDGPEHATERMNAAQYVAALAATPHPEQE
jgi:hypothetical protein